MPSNEDNNWYIAPRTRSVRGQLYQLLSKFEGINWFILFLRRFSNTNPSTLKTLSQDFSTFLHKFYLIYSRAITDILHDLNDLISHGWGYILSNHSQWTLLSIILFLSRFSLMYREQYYCSRYIKENRLKNKIIDNKVHCEWFERIYPHPWLIKSFKSWWYKFLIKKSQHTDL